MQVLLQRQNRFAVLDLQKTFSAISLAEVSKWLGYQIDKAHEFIQEMIDQGALNATIDLGGAEPVLRFYSNKSLGPFAKSEREYYVELKAQAQRANLMAEYVGMANRRLTLAKEYIDALRRRAKNKANGDDGQVLGEDAGEMAELDEDIMMDA